MNKLANTIALLSFLFILFSCTNKKNHLEIITNQWIGTEIILPKTVDSATPSVDAANFNSIEKRCKILIYADSIGCVSCKLNLSGWKLFIEDVEKSHPNQVEFIFFINSIEYDVINLIIKYHEFDHPIIINKENIIGKLNNIPKEINLQVFLLNNNNKVLLVGDPTSDMNIKNLYIETIENIIIETGLNSEYFRK